MNIEKLTADLAKFDNYFRDNIEKQLHQFNLN